MHTGDRTAVCPSLRGVKDVAHRKERHERDACADLQAPVAEEGDDLPQMLHAPDPDPPRPRLLAAPSQILALLGAQTEALVIQVQRHVRQSGACQAFGSLKVVVIQDRQLYWGTGEC